MAKLYAESTYPVTGYGFQNTRYPAVRNSHLIFPKLLIEFFEEHKAFVYKPSCLGVEIEAAVEFGHRVKSQCLYRFFFFLLRAINIRAGIKRVSSLTGYIAIE